MTYQDQRTAVAKAISAVQDRVWVQRRIAAREFERRKPKPGVKR